MKRIVLSAAIAALAACSQPATETEAAEETAAAEPAATAEAAVMAADGQPAPGKYKILTSDGQTFNEELKPDGTYVQTDADGKVVETGKWVQKSSEEYCYTVDAQYAEDGKAPAEQCNKEGIGADDKWFSTNAKGETATVERVTI